MQKTKKKIKASEETKKFNYMSAVKWLLLFISLMMTTLLILTLYNGTWGFGKWETSSVMSFSGSSSGPVGHGGAYYRTKQLIIAFLGGGTLAFAGTLLQKVTRNNLAEVSILGIGSINIMFIFAYIYVFKEQVFGGSIVAILLPFLTISASIIGTLFVWLISKSKRANKNTFVIIGIATQLLFEALSVIFVNPSKLQGKQGQNIWNTIKNYTMGQMRVDDGPGAHPIPYWLIWTAAVTVGLVIVAALLLRKKIDIYESSEESATALGISVGKLKFVIFMLVAVLAGVEATILGTVALLGIIAPSISKMIFKNRFGAMALGSFIIGGILVMLASFISTNLGTHLPPGILSTAIAVPYFIFLVLRGK